MKDIIYYTLLHRWANGDGLAILGVTSESGRSRINGRMIAYNEPTHCRREQCIGRFETEQAAREKIVAVKAIRAAHEKTIKDARDALRNAENAQTRAIQAELAS